MPDVAPSFFDRPTARDVMALAYHLLFNLFIGIILKYVDRNFALFNIDLVLLSCLFFIRNYIRAVFYALIILAMFLDAIAGRFGFDLLEFIFQAREVSFDIMIANHMVILGGVGLVTVLAGVGAALPTTKPIIAIGAVLLIVGIDSVQGSSATIHVDGVSHRFGRIDIANSELNRIRVQALTRSNIVDPASAKPAKAASDVFDGPAAGARVLIVVESLGILTDARSDTDYGYGTIFARHPSLSVVSRGNVRSFGGTVSGELRELCHIAIPTIATLTSYRSCLPWIMRAQGYRAIGAHSYRGSMFARDGWWPKAGFQSATFRNDRTAVYPACPRTLDSLCDGPMLAGELQQALQHRKLFFYYLSSNSHLPVPNGMTVHGLLEEALDDVLESIERAARRSGRTDIDIAIVGDHPPPVFGFSNARYVAGIVPYWRLAYRGHAPRNDGAPDRTTRPSQ